PAANAADPDGRVERRVAELAQALDRLAQECSRVHLAIGPVLRPELCEAPGASGPPVAAEVRVESELALRLAGLCGLANDLAERLADLVNRCEL
ncbi:MAG TPA: hypothetical protein VFU47_02480, partial [Armatimonadota bacterium]|nr:hypothetical protein [Armatimonadota bacterium]